MTNLLKNITSLRQLYGSISYLCAQSLQEGRSDQGNQTVVDPWGQWSHDTTYHFPPHWKLWPDCSEDPAPGNSLWRWPSPGAAPPPCCQWCGNTWLRCLWNRRDSILSVKLSHPWQDETRWGSPHRRSPSPRRSFRHSTFLRTASMLSTTKTTKWWNYHEACFTLVLPRSLP